MRTKLILGILCLVSAAEATVVYTELTHDASADGVPHENRPGVMYWQGATDRHAVALTFDDGPSPYTSKILAVLARHQVKATFFVVGKRVDQYPDLARRVVAAGHVIANHSYSHRNLNLETSADVASELARTESIIARTTGVKPALFRPPFGEEDRKSVV